MVLWIQENQGLNFSKGLLVELFNLSERGLPGLPASRTRLTSADHISPATLPSGYHLGLANGKQWWEPSGWEQWKKREQGVQLPPPLPCPIAMWCFDPLTLSRLQLSHLWVNLSLPLPFRLRGDDGFQLLLIPGGFLMLVGSFHSVHTSVNSPFLDPLQ